MVGDHFAGVRFFEGHDEAVLLDEPFDFGVFLRGEDFAVEFQEFFIEPAFLPVLNGHFFGRGLDAAGNALAVVDFVDFVLAPEEVDFFFIRVNDFEPKPSLQEALDEEGVVPLPDAHLTTTILITSKSTLSP